MMTKKIIVIEDEEAIQELLHYNLNKEGYDITCVENGEEGIKTAKKELPDLIILDLMLPGIDGLEACKILKNDPLTEHLPIVMLTAKGEEADIIVGLELGADDYIIKPFSPRVLLARIKAVLRRKATKPLNDDETVRYKKLTLKPGPHKVLIDNNNVDLTPSEFKLLHILMKKPGWVFTRSKIVDVLRGNQYAVTDRSIDVVVVGLRKKMGICSEYLQTVRGVGYRFGE